jgi:hypothetical protein
MDARVKPAHDEVGLVACPGRGAAFFMPLRRAGTAQSAVFGTVPVLRSITPRKSGVLHRARDTGGYDPRPRRAGFRGGSFIRGGFTGMWRCS